MKLKELITQYAAFRKSMGAEFKSAESLLNTFCRHVGVERDTNEIGLSASCPIFTVSTNWKGSLIPPLRSESVSESFNRIPSVSFWCCCMGRVYGSARPWLSHCKMWT